MQDLQSKKLIGKCHRENIKYILDELKMSVIIAAANSVDPSSFRFSSSSSSFYLWHSYLGYVLSSCLRFLVFIGALGNLQTCDIFYCSGCKLAKFFALPFNQTIFISSSPLDLI